MVFKDWPALINQTLKGRTIALVYSQHARCDL